MKLNIIILFLAAFSFSQCTPKQDLANQGKKTASDMINSKSAKIDAASMHLVESMEQSMGGRKAYDAIETIQWNFFGARMWWWNKNNGDVRVEHLKDDVQIVMNIHSREGRVIQNGAEITNAAEMKEWMDKCYAWWINDSYWLVMPFKLRDPGIQLDYIGTKETTDGNNAEVSRLTFDQVGITPNNGYDLYFDPQTHMLIQWDFFKEASEDDKAGFQMPWKGYESYGGVKFSGDRGQRKIPSIAVDENWSKGTFTDPTIKAKVF